MHLNKLCPYRTETIIYHNDKKNYMIPNHGFNKIMSYDVSEVSFKPCLEEKCMFFDHILQSCNLNKTNSYNSKKQIK